MSTNDLVLAHEAITRVKVERDKINSEVSRIDKEVNDHYHVLELLELNGAEMVKIASSLKKLLRQRRKLKEQQIAFSNFLSATVESAKSPAVSTQNGADRKSKYTAEALSSYEKIFGKKKGAK